MEMIGRARALMQEAVRRHQGGDLAGAVELYRQVLALTPGDANLLQLLGLALHQNGAHAEGAGYIRRAVDQVPNHPVLRNNLGDALRMAGDPQAAIEQFQAALALRPGYAGAHLNLCAAMSALGDHDGALDHGQQAVRLAPDLPDAHYNLGLALQDALRLEEAATAFREVLRLDPEHPKAAGNLLYLLNLIPGLDPQAIAAEHRALGARLDRLADRAPARPRDAGAPIRIGYLSRDFRRHAVNHFLEPVLDHHDRSRFAVCCYADVAEPDAVTARLAGIAELWRDVRGWSDERLCAQIRDDRIDILFDLAGHTDHSRLGVHARRAAPLQIGWLGYPNTTGLAAIDWRIVDAHSAPADEPGCEALLRMPQVFACFRPAANAPEVAAAPCLAGGGPTFGALHRLEKINYEVVDLWSRLLLAMPQARLLIARDELDGWQQRRLVGEFAARGVPAERLELRRLDGSRSFLVEFADIDVLLDCFPWSGHTIACAALWQGVPVVTLEGRNHAARMVSSTLRAVGLEQCVATDADAYLRIAATLAADPPRLAELRAGLRAQVAASPLCDEAGFTRALEERLAAIVMAAGAPRG